MGLFFSCMPGQTPDSGMIPTRHTSGMEISKINRMKWFVVRKGTLLTWAWLVPSRALCFSRYGWTPEFQTSHDETISLPYEGREKGHIASSPLQPSFVRAVTGERGLPLTHSRDWSNLSIGIKRAQMVGRSFWKIASSASFLISFLPGIWSLWSCLFTEGEIEGRILELMEWVF